MARPRRGIVVQINELMKRLSIAFIISGLAFLTSCKFQKEGLVLMTDDSYKASVFATNKTGIEITDMPTYVRNFK